MRRTLVLGLLALCGCDPIATGSFKPPFLTVNGVIEGSSAMVTPRDVRVALLWQNDQTPGQSYAENLVDVLSIFPADFAVPLTDRPKEQVVDSLPPDVAAAAGVDPKMRWSVATIVVYSDENQNGKLDIVGPSDPPSPDRVLAAATDFDVWSLSGGQPAPSDFIGVFPVTPGFSLVSEPPPHDPVPGECGQFTPQGHFSNLCPVAFTQLSLLDPATFVEQMTLSDDPRLQGYTCNAYWGPLEYPDWYQASLTDVCDGGACRFCRGYQCPPDRPMPGDIVTCSTDNLAYVYKRCTEDASLCGTTFCHFGHDELQAGDPIPSDWPCPLP